MIVERQEMAHSIRVEKVFHIRQIKNFPFFVSNYLEKEFQIILLAKI